MEADLSRIKVALAVMSNAELDALIKATYKVPQMAPGLLSWRKAATGRSQPNGIATDSAAVGQQRP